jgi:hypothetical protein
MRREVEPQGAYFEQAEGFVEFSTAFLHVDYPLTSQGESLVATQQEACSIP